MSIEKLNHYALESIPSVYDEEAMTALEMCGRLGKKVNEVITAVNGWEVPQIVNVSPTGDKSGELDRAVIQGKLDAGYAVHLSGGEYYLNGPLLFQPGYMLRGDSQLNTVLNCKAGFIDHADSVSVDHIEVRDIRVKGPGEGIGIDISRKVESIETGGRYAHFQNVYISGYDTGVLLGGCWSTNFTHCRIEANKTCVKQRGTCNHIKYDHCVFLGPNGVPYDNMTAVGIDIGTEAGAENYGISIDHCDFERFEFCVKAYCCVALNVSHLYVEWSRKVFELDTCPSFLCDGGYVSYSNRICNNKKTNTADLFAKCSGAIKNLFVRANRPETWALTSAEEGFPLTIEGITVKNDGVGTCYSNAQLYTSIYNGVSKMDTYNIGLSEANFKNFTSIRLRPNVDAKCGKLVSATFTPVADFTLSAQQKIFVGIPGLADQMLTITLHAGEHKAWNTITSTAGESVGTDYSKLIFGPTGTSHIMLSTPGFGVEAPGFVDVKLVTGDMIL